MPYLITSAPEAKIFQPHLQKDLLEHPEKIFEKESVEIYVPRSCGRITFVSGKPRMFDRPQSSDKCEEFDSTIRWLTGGIDGSQVQETDC